MLDSNEKNTAPEPSPEPSTSTSQSTPANSVIFNGLTPGLREIEATYEMLVHFKRAIQENEHWKGSDTPYIGMGLQLVTQMESQYRAKLEQGRNEQKEAMKRAKESIKKVGGKFDASTEVVS